MNGAEGADPHRHRRFPKCKAINGLRTGCASRMLSLTGSSGLRSLSEPSGDISASDNGWVSVALALMSREASRPTVRQLTRLDG
jgi:hypothetical protein